MLKRKHRVGTTLVELLVVLVLLAMVGGAIMRLVVSQRRFLGAAEAAMTVARVAREGADIPRQELRAVAPASGGIYEMAEDHIDFRSLIGSSVLCTIDSSRSVVSIPNRQAWGALTTWIAAPREGDSVQFLDATDTSHPVWRVHTLASAPAPGGSCPLATGFARTSAEEGESLSFRVTPLLEPTLESGAALRIFRRARFELYRAGDALWYLGFVDCAPARAVPCSVVQPVSGPFAPAGLRFVFHDSAGSSTADPARVARIDVVARARTRDPLRAVGFALGFRTDSMAAVITLRNR